MEEKEFMQKWVNRLNERGIHPEKDYDLLLEELQEIGIYFEDSKNGTFWYFDNE